MSQPTGHLYNSPESTKQYGEPPMPEHMPLAPKPVKTKKKWLMPVLVAVALLFGFGFGSVSNPAPPAVETTKEVEKRVEVKVPVVPPSCAVAFEHAEDVFASAARISTVFKDAISAVAAMNVPGINAQTEKIKAENAVVEVTGPKYQSAKAKCLAG